MFQFAKDPCSTSPADHSRTTWNSFTGGFALSVADGTKLK